MSKLEKPMIVQFWESVGGTLITEFQAVQRAPGVGRRLLDAVILPRGPKTEAHWRDVSIDGEDVIIVQAKAHRLGMYLMGRGLEGSPVVDGYVEDWTGWPELMESRIVATPIQPVSPIKQPGDRWEADVFLCGSSFPQWRPNKPRQPTAEKRGG